MNTLASYQKSKFLHIKLEDASAITLINFLHNSLFFSTFTDSLFHKSLIVVPFRASTKIISLMALIMSFTPHINIITTELPYLCQYSHPTLYRTTVTPLLHI